MYGKHKLVDMAIKKQFLKSRPICKVTFTVEAEGAGQVAVVGDFNAWDPEAGALKKQKGGSFKGSFDLPKEQSYEFRYLIDGTFSNEPGADRFQWNAYAGAENGVLDV